MFQLVSLVASYKADAKRMQGGLATIKADAKRMHEKG